MIWKYCEDCHINGHCENQDKGHECNMYAKRITDKAELLQKQLDIAVKCLKQYAEIKDILMVSKDGTCQITLRDCEGYHLARETLKEIEGLNEIHKQE